MEYATGALGTLLPKLGQLLKDEYNLHKGAKKNIEFLTRELQSIHIALRSVGEVPREEVNDLVKVWARDVRELSYDMEDMVDIFLVRIQGTDRPSKNSIKRFFKEMIGFVAKAKIRHDISQEITDIKERVKEIAERRDRYKVDAVTHVKTIDVDPRIAYLYTKAADLVGINDSRDEVITRLTKGDDTSVQKQRIVSIVGLGGLGKTTLAKAVYDRLKGQFDCMAFVPVGRNPDMKKVLKDILIDLDKQYMSPNFATLDERQLINESKEFLEKKRYFIVIDDVWETGSWETIKLAFVENNSGSRIIITTRNQEVAKEAGEVYKLQQLSDDSSRKLFFGRMISGSESKFSDHQPDDEVSNKILKKCEGIPLAIITMASLLVAKPMEQWSEVHRSIGFGNQQIENTTKILSFSYYDLPSHLRTCLLYLSVFPEDYFINKNTLVWMWIAEGFVQKKQGMSLFEIGEGYFYELVNRSMIQLVEMEGRYLIVVCGCRVHDMVLDLIRSISSDENFVTIVGNNNELGGKVRRLALQNNKTVKAHMDMQLVRSFISLWWDIDKGISLSRFKLVRVLSIHTTSYSYSSNQCHLQVPLKNLLHLRYLGLIVPSRIVLPAEEIGNLKFLQTLDVGEYGMINEEVIVSVSLLTELLCLRFRGWINIVPDGIGKLTSLEELETYYGGQEEEPWREFVKELSGLRELRVLRLGIAHPSTYFREVQNDMVLQSLRNLQKLEILSLTTPSSPVHADAAAWEADGFLLSRRLRRLSLRWISFSRFPSFCINPSRLPNLSHLSLHVDAMDEQDLRILGGLPQLGFLKLVVHSIAEVVRNNNTTYDDGCLFQNLRRCRIWCKGVRFLLPASQEDSSSTSFCMRNVQASMLLLSEREDTIRRAAAGVVPTPMPSVQELYFLVYMQEFIQDGNHDNDYVILGLEYFASLQNVGVCIHCDDDSPDVVVEQVEAALRRAADVHHNRPTLTVTRTRRASHHSTSTPAA